MMNTTDRILRAKWSHRKLLDVEKLVVKGAALENKVRADP